MAKLPNLKKAIKRDRCAVMRCKDRAEAAIDARQAWPERDASLLPLCPKHLRQVGEWTAAKIIAETPAALNQITLPSDQIHGPTVQPPQLPSLSQPEQFPDMQACLAVLCDMSVRNAAQEGDLARKEETLAVLRSLPIRSQQDISSADGILRDIKRRLSWWKKTKTTCRKPFNEKLEEVSGWCNPPIEFYSEAERIVKTRIRDGMDEMEKERTASLQSVQAAHQAGDMQTVQAMVQAAGGAEAHLPQGMYRTTRFSFQINAPDLVPRHFCSPDEKKIRAHVDAHEGRVDIPGVTVWPDDIMGQRK